jgi:hypothetical protein
MLERCSAIRRRDAAVVEFGAVGGRLRLESRDAAGANGRYEIDISGGASHVQVTTEGASA